MPKAKSKQDKTTERNQELVTSLHDMFSTALDHPTWRSWRTNAQKCFQYKEGDQWTSAELAELKKRGQPATVNNQVKVTLDRLTGQFVKQRTRIGFRGRNYPQDEPIGQVLSESFRYISQNTNLEFEERDMFEDGCTGGFGCLEVHVKFNEMYEPEIMVRDEDCFNIFPDPFSRRYDWNEDAAYICRAKWVDIDEAKSLYPSHASELSSFVGGEADGFLASIDNFKLDNYVDSKQQRVRLVEVWYKDRSKKSILLLQNGESYQKDELTSYQWESLKKANPKARVLDQVRSKMKVGIFTGWILLDHKDSPHGHDLFPFIPYFTGRKKSGEPYSMIWTALTLQDAINKRESKALHLLSSNQFFVEQGGVNDKAETANELARPDGFVELNRGYFEKFKVEKNLELAQTQFSMHTSSIGDFRRVTGVNPDALGERSEVRSGVGIARKQQMTDLILAPVFDNLRRTRVILAKVVLEMIKVYWNEKKLFYITDDLNASKAVTLDETSLKAIKEGIYDVIAEDMPDTTTLQQEQLQIVSQTLPQVIPFGPAYVQLFIEMSDIPKKEALLEKIKAMSIPPPSDAKFSVSLQWAELTPQEKAVFAAKKLGMPELAQIEMTAGTPPAHLSKIAAEQGNDGGQAQKSQVEVFKTLSDTQQARESHVMKTQFEREKHQMAMQKGQLDIAKTVIAAQASKDKGEKKPDG